MKIEFEIPVCPVAKERPRFSKYGTYTPARTKEFEISIKHWIRKNSPKDPLIVPLRVHLSFHLPKPKKCKFKYPAVRPDIDNYIKAVLDAGNGILWKDDGLIWLLSATKTYAVNESKIEVVIYHD